PPPPASADPPRSAEQRRGLGTFGDPLPPHAPARAGTPRLPHRGPTHPHVFSAPWTRPGPGGDDGAARLRGAAPGAATPPAGGATATGFGRWPFPATAGPSPRGKPRTGSACGTAPRARSCAAWKGTAACSSVPASPVP